MRLIIVLTIFFSFITGTVFPQNTPVQTNKPKKEAGTVEILNKLFGEFYALNPSDVAYIRLRGALETEFERYDWSSFDGRSSDGHYRLQEAVFQFVKDKKETGMSVSYAYYPRLTVVGRIEDWAAYLTEKLESLQRSKEASTKISGKKTDENDENIKEANAIKKIVKDIAVIAIGENTTKVKLQELDANTDALRRFRDALWKIYKDWKLSTKGLNFLDPPAGYASYAGAMGDDRAFRTAHALILDFLDKSRQSKKRNGKKWSPQKSDPNGHLISACSVLGKYNENLCSYCNPVEIKEIKLKTLQDLLNALADSNDDFSKNIKDSVGKLLEELSKEK
jgi:hypothetical protein